MPANRWRTVFREYPEGLDLSDTPFVSFAVNTEGGAYGADYYVRLTVGRGGRKFESMAKVTPKEWNVTIFDLSECPFADRIDRVEFALCNASDSVWENALYQLDGFEAGKPIDLSFGLKGSTELFTAEGGAVSQGDGTLEFAFDEGGSLSTPSLAGSRNGIYNPKLEDRNTMFFVMENRSPADRLRIRFVTAKDSVYNDEKSKIFDIDPNSPKKGYFFNFSDLPQAEGALTGFPHRTARRVRANCRSTALRSSRKPSWNLSQAASTAVRLRPSGSKSGARFRPNTHRNTPASPSMKRRCTKATGVSKN